jgi:hypothetical protein
MICEGCVVLNETQNDMIIFYITKKPSNKVVSSAGDIDYKYLENETQAYVIAYLDKNKISVSSLYAKEKGTRQGTAVLKAMCDFVIQTYPRIKYVELDDSTGVNPPKNIYYKLGFKVRDKVTKNFIKWDTWLSRYKGVDNPSEERRIDIHSLVNNIR